MCNLRPVHTDVFSVCLKTYFVSCFSFCVHLPYYKAIENADHFHQERILF